MARLKNWFGLAARGSRRKKTSPARSRARGGAALEQLEERRVLATWGAATFSTTPASGRYDTWFDINFRIEDVTSNGFLVYWRISGDANVDSNDFSLGSNNYNFFVNNADIEGDSGFRMNEGANFWTSPYGAPDAEERGHYTLGMWVRSDNGFDQLVATQPISIEPPGPPPDPDIILHSLVADGAGTLHLDLEVKETLPQNKFQLKLVRSTNSTYDAGDTPLQPTLEISGADAAPGRRTLLFGIGAGAGNLALPGAGADEVDADYFVLAVADPDNAIQEKDANALTEDNTVSLQGVYNADNQQVMVHGTAQADTIRLDAEDARITLADQTYDFGVDEVQQIRVHSHDASDHLIVDAGWGFGANLEIFDWGGVGGNRATIFGLLTNDRAVLGPAGGVVRSDLLFGNSYKVNLKQVAQTTVEGKGGEDLGELYDSTSDDYFEADSTQAKLYGGPLATPFVNTLVGFRNVFAFATKGGADKATLRDTPGNDKFSATGGSASLEGSNYSLDTEAFDRVYAYSTLGDDEAKFHNTPGDDNFLAKPEYALMKGEGYYNYAQDFAKVVAYGSREQNDVASLYDSAGDDTFRATPAYSSMTGAGYNNQARGFPKAYGYASQGGPNDRAQFYDSEGDDLFQATPEYSRITGENYFAYAKSFDRSFAYSTKGGTNDRAELTGSDGSDTFYGRPTDAFFRGANFYYLATGFDKAYAYAKEGANDTAYFYDTENAETFTASPVQADLSGHNFFNGATGFDRTIAYGTLAGAQDYALLTDSPGDDVFTANAENAQFKGDGFNNSVQGFRRVTGRAENGGNDRAELRGSALDDSLVSHGQANYLRLGGPPRGGSGFEFDNLAEGFDVAYGYAGAGGTDDATMYDSPGNDTFTAKPTSSQFTGPGFNHYAKGFKNVEAVKLIGGVDRAIFYDSALEDIFSAAADYARMFDTGFTYENKATHFDKTYAFANAGGNDRAFLFDSVNNDVFTSNEDVSQLVGPGFANYAYNFERIEASADANGGSDTAIIYDSSSHDGFYGRDNYAQMSNQFYFVKATYFERVKAINSSGGFDSLDVTAVDYLFEKVGDWT